MIIAAQKLLTPIARILLFFAIYSSHTIFTLLCRFIDSISKSRQKAQVLFVLFYLLWFLAIFKRFDGFCGIPIDYDILGDIFGCYRTSGDGRIIPDFLHLGKYLRLCLSTRGCRFSRLTQKFPFCLAINLFFYIFFFEIKNEIIRVIDLAPTHLQASFLLSKIKVFCINFRFCNFVMAI